MKKHTNLTYILKKFLKMFLTILFVTSFIFFLVRLMPSNPIDQYINNQIAKGGVTYEQAVARAKHLFTMDLNKPMIFQYFDYIKAAFRLDFGESLLTPGVKVMTIIGQRLPWTLFTVGIGLILAFVIGVAMGAVAAFGRNRWYGTLISGIASVLSTIPDFLIAIFLILLLGVFTWGGHGPLVSIMYLRGNMSPGITPGFNGPFIADIFHHALAPILTYTLAQVGVLTLLMKGSTTSCLSTDYVKMARIRGLSPSKVLFSYIGRNAMLPMVTELAMRMGLIIGGSLIIEQLFVYPGIGMELLKATNGRDYPLMQGIFLIMSIAMVLSNFLAEILYFVLDPRIKRNGHGG